MTRHHSSQITPPSAAERAAQELHQALAERGIATDVHSGHGIALVSVWAGLVVWCDGNLYRWRTGRTSPITGRPLYTLHGCDRPEVVASYVALRHAELRATNPLPLLFTEAAVPNMGSPR
jgi:hypothetical protein